MKQFILLFSNTPFIFNSILEKALIISLTEYSNKTVEEE